MVHATAAPNAGDSGASTVMTRSEVAAELGIARTTVRRMEGKQLHPRRGPGGLRVFDAMEVRQVTRRMVLATGGASEAPDAVAAAVLAALESGADPVQVVIDQRVAPRVVLELQAMRVRLRGGLLLSPATVATLRAPDLLGVDVTSEEELVDAVRRVALPPPCTGCGRPLKTALCKRCRVRRGGGSVGAEGGEG